MFKSYLFLFLIVCFCSCQEDKPYHEFEEKLVVSICKCINISKITSKENFLIEYENCTKNTTSLLKSGLDHYPEDPRLSKEAYKVKLPQLLEELKSTDRCDKLN